MNRNYLPQKWKGEIIIQRKVAHYKYLFSVLPKMYLTRNVSVTNGKELSPAIDKICAEYYWKK
jgi:hypothetical protein